MVSVLIFYCAAVWKFPTIWRASRPLPSADSEGTAAGYFAPGMYFELHKVTKGFLFRQAFDRQTLPSHLYRIARSRSLPYCQNQSSRIICTNGILECCTDRTAPPISLPPRISTHFFPPNGKFITTRIGPEFG